MLVNKPYHHALTLAFMFGCAQEPTVTLPAFLQQLTASIEAGDVAESPGSIWQYNYKGRTVFYVPPQPCCDFASALYTETGEILCSPDGGITGDGDGRCADFVQLRTAELRVWKDARVPLR